MTIAHRLRHLRTQRGLSQENLARKAGLSAAHINRLERGSRAKVGPHLETLKLLAQGLGVSLIELLDGVEA